MPHSQACKLLACMLHMYADSHISLSMYLLAPNLTFVEGKLNLKRCASTFAMWSSVHATKFKDVPIMFGFSHRRCQILELGMDMFGLDFGIIIGHV